MSQKIVVGPLQRGLRNDVTPFNVDNDSFPVLINAYQWRGRVKRKRGTALLGRLQRFFNSLSTSYNPGSTTFVLGNAGGNGTGNLLTGFTNTLQTNADIVIGSVIIIDSTAGNIYTDSNGILTGIPSGTGTINYATGAFVITGAAGHTVSATFIYNPDLPVMGLRDVIANSAQFPNTLAFDTKFAYNVVTSGSFPTYDVSFYKNPPSGSYTEYTAKTVVTPLTWNGQDYQQFWTTNFQGALWATNGAPQPFSAANIGMQFKPIVSSTPVRTGPPAIVNLQINGHGLVVGDFVFVNEVSTAGLNGYISAATQTNPVAITSNAHGLTTGNTVTIENVVGMTELNGNTYTITVTGVNTFTLNGVNGTTFGAYISGGEWFSPVSQHPASFSQINFQTGYVTTVVNANNVQVTFPNATINTSGLGGIAQYLTRSPNPTLDCLRWYDGDPTNGSPTTPVLSGSLGWVNFAPPLSSLNFTIADEPAAQYYLVGAKLIQQFKDRLVFFGPVIQTSVIGAAPIYLQDTIIFSQNGTPYYTSSFTGDPTLATTIFNPVLVPAGQTATASAYWEDLAGYGGYLTSGLDQQITTVAQNEDVLIVGFNRYQTRLVYTGNDLLPFNFFVVNSELGSGSTFTAITMDQGVLTLGSRGFISTNQTGTQRIDLEIPDEAFQVSLSNNGAERATAARDYISEWIYFTYPYNNADTIPMSTTYKFPTQTLQYNYRDNSWAVFRESYTTYGLFRKQTGLTWATVGQIFPTWSEWNQPWNSSLSSVEVPLVIAGNQQGFILIRNQGTGEGNSLFIQAISGSTITSPDHSLAEGDYIVISGCLGTNVSAVNGKIFSVGLVTQNTFTLNPGPSLSVTYTGGGLIQRMYVPFIQTRQFPTAWEMGRKTRIGVQRYLFTSTFKGQISLLIYLSEDANTPYNNQNFPFGPNIPPDPASPNNALVYSTTLFTCPESINLGLTAANVNLQTPTSFNQQQIWHRMNTSLIGDTVQIGFTLSDSQMRDTNFNNQFDEIELHSFILDISPSQMLV